MKFLLDVCCSSRSLRRLLVELDHDVRLVSEAHPRASDGTVLAMAHEQGRIVITEDKDFGEFGRCPAAPSFWYHSLPRIVRFRTSHSHARSPESLSK
jgi:predicted nuclease of predicted toxin-antitoxin system